MNTRPRPVAVLILLAGLNVSPVLAQSPPIERDRPKAGSFLKQIGLRLDPLPDKNGERPSHRPLNTDLANNLDPEEALAQRLQGVRLRQFLDQGANPEFQKQLQGLARKFLDDPKLLESLRKNLRPEDIERLGQSLRDGKIGNDPAMQKLLEEGKSLYKQGKLGKTLSAEEQKLLEKFGEKMKDGGIKPPITDKADNPVDNPTGGANQGGPTSGPETQPGDSPWDRLAEKSASWLERNLTNNVKNIDGWIDSPSGIFWRDTLTKLMKEAGETRSQTSNLTDRARGLTRHLPRISNWLPKNLMPKPAPLPNLPRLAMPNAPRPGVPSLADSGKVVLWAAVLGLVALVLWRGGGWWQQHRAAARASAWKLGPWPVRPGEVSTRADLVRAFEHLALLILGPIARTCHHLELGERLGASAASESSLTLADTRRRAAGTLARLYEQARYTPDEEKLPPEMMADARRELVYLAGVVQG
jgi:hypothetical protein